MVSVSAGVRSDLNSRQALGSRRSARSGPTAEASSAAKLLLKLCWKTGSGARDGVLSDDVSARFGPLEPQPGRVPGVLEN